MKKSKTPQKVTPGYDWISFDSDDVKRAMFFFAYNRKPTEGEFGELERVRITESDSRTSTDMVMVFTNDGEE